MIEGGGLGNRDYCAFIASQLFALWRAYVFISSNLTRNHLQNVRAVLSTGGQQQHLGIFKNHHSSESFTFVFVVVEFFIYVHLTMNINDDAIQNSYVNNFGYQLLQDQCPLEQLTS